MLNLVWRASALDDVETIFDFIAERNTRAARELRADLNACAERLRQFPFMYRAGRVAGTREAVVHPNYLMIYRVLPARVEIVAVIHARRSYP